MYVAVSKDLDLNRVIGFYCGDMVKAGVLPTVQDTRHMRLGMLSQRQKNPVVDIGLAGR